MRARVQSEPWLGALVAAAAALYTVFSLLRWDHFMTLGFDLGIFDQTVWRYSRFETPENVIRGVDHIWGDHFSPILMLLAPLYWIWEDARMLLLAQAVLLAGAAVPIFLYARDAVGRAPAYLLAAAYLVFWGVQSALNFDFHELAFAPVLLAGLLLAVRRRSWRAYFALLVGLLCVKEDQSIVAVALGIYVLTFGAWRQGLATIALGIAWYVLVVRLLIPHFNPAGEYPYFAYTAFGDDALSALGHAITHPGQVVSTLFDDPSKRELLLFCFAPFAGLALLSRAVLLMVPLIAQRLLSDNELYWTTDYHYTLSLAAILFVAAADGMRTVARRLPWPPQRSALGLAALVLALNVGFMASFERDLTGLARPGFYRAPAGVADVERAVAAVPEGVSVAGQDNVIVRFAHREVAAEISDGTGPTDYVIANVLGTLDNVGQPGTVSRYIEARLPTHVPVAYHGGWLVLADRKLRPERTPALPPLEAAAAERLRTSVQAWTTELLRYLPTLDACGDPGCFEEAGAAFRRRHAALTAQLVRLEDRWRGGCSDLAGPATGVVVGLGSTLESLRLAGAEGDAAAVAEHRARLRDAETQEAGGFVSRLVGLCAT